MLSLPTQLTFELLLKIPNLNITLTSNPNPSADLSSEQPPKIQIHPSLDFYSPTFLKTFMAIKLNSLSKIQPLMSQQQTQINRHLSKMVNHPPSIPVSESQPNLIQNIISILPPCEFSNDIMRDNFLEGNCLPATILTFATKESLRLLYLHQLSCSLTFQVFDGRTNAFIPICHVQKNHSGQLLFANQINNLILHNEKKSQLGQLRSTQHSRVQDAYSTRCSPQIAGVSYEMVTECIQFLDHETNEYQLGNIPIGQEFFPSTHSNERCVQLFDCLAISLHEITSVSLVRSERMLNKLINRMPSIINQRIQSHTFLFSILQSISSRFLQNKTLCSPISSDTVSRNNYQKDTQNNIYLMYKKYITMWKNMKLILSGEILIATYALRELKGHYKRELTPKLEEVYGKAWEVFGEMGKGGKVGDMLRAMEGYAEGMEEGKVYEVMKYLPYERPHEHH